MSGEHVESRGLRHSPCGGDVQRSQTRVCCVHRCFVCPRSLQVWMSNIESKHEHLTMCQILRVRVCISFPVLHSCHRRRHGDAAIDVLVHEMDLLLLGKISDVRLTLLQFLASADEGPGCFRHHWYASPVAVMRRAIPTFLHA